MRWINHCFVERNQKTVGDVRVELLLTGGGWRSLSSGSTESKTLKVLGFIGKIYLNRRTHAGQKTVLISVLQRCMSLSSVLLWRATRSFIQGGHKTT